MPIYVDTPRKWTTFGKRWSHVWCPTTDETVTLGKRLGLKRYDRKPFPHWDVTAEELDALLTFCPPGTFEHQTREQVAEAVRRWRAGVRS